MTTPWSRLREPTSLVASYLCSIGCGRRVGMEGLYHAPGFAFCKRCVERLREVLR